MSTDDIQKKYEEKFKQLEAKAAQAALALQRDGEQLEKDAKQPFKLEITVKWVDKKMSLDLPQFSMKTKELKFDLPQVTMKTKRIVFHTPSVRMVMRVVGRYPEFRGFPPKITWREIKTNVPETFMERQEISFDIPEFKFDTTSLKLDLPDFRMERTEFSMKVPEVAIGDISFVIPIEDDGLQDRSEKLKLRGEALAAELGEEAAALATAMQAEMLVDAQSDAHSAANASAGGATEAFTAGRTQLVDAIAKIDAALRSENGGRLDDDARAALAKNRAELAAALDRLSSEFDEFEKDLKAETAEVDG